LTWVVISDIVASRCPLLRKTKIALVKSDSFQEYAEALYSVLQEERQLWLPPSSCGKKRKKKTSSLFAGSLTHDSNITSVSALVNTSHCPQSLIVSRQTALEEIINCQCNSADTLHKF